MNPNWLGVISAILAIVAFSVTYRMAMRVERKKRDMAALLSVFLALPGASFALYYLHFFPEPAWYYQFRSVPGTEFFTVLLGVCGGLVASTLSRIFLILPLLLVTVFSLAPIIKPFIGPISKEDMADSWDGEVCIQSTPSTCGAASSATILKSLGVESTESELAAEAHSYMGGTEAWYLARVVRARGLEPRFRLSQGFDAEINFPAIAGVRLGKVGHFIPILRKEGEQFLIGDPLRGEELLSLETLLERYDFTGFYMEFRKK